MRHAALVATSLVLFGACNPDRLRPDDSELRASPGELNWQKAWVGYSSTLTLQLENTGRAARAVHVSAAPPFSVAETDLEVPAGSRIDLQVRFRPDQPGHATGFLEVSSPPIQLRIPLSGDALAVPGCGEEQPCHAMAFDALLGVCMNTVLPDGAGCTASCVEAGTCHGGICLGTSSLCDDGDACTLDGCDQEVGCIQVASTASCPSPNEACRVAFCDPTTGCGVTNAVDGTSCGPADCVSAKVCLAGACTVVSVPEGAPCGAESPCQDRGTCHQQQCVRPEATTLVPVWSYTPPPSFELMFTGVADAAGNLYWLECESPACSLVSFTRDGLERYRVPLRGSMQPASLKQGTVVLVGGAVAVAQLDFVELFRSSDGAQLWFRDLRSELAPGSPTNSHLQLGPIVDLGNGRIALRAAPGSVASSGFVSWVVALSTATGATSWTWESSGFIGSLIAQADGTSWLYVLPVSSTGQERLVALTRDGEVQASSMGATGMPVATYGDRLILTGGAMLSTLTREKVGELGHVGFTDDPTPLIGRGFAYAIENVSGSGSYLQRFTTIAGEVQWEARLDQLGTPSPPLASETSEPMLTSDEGVLVAKGDSGGREWDLVKVSSEGDAEFACHLPGTARYSDAVLSTGRWTAAPEFNGARVVSFDLGSAALAPTGWTMAGGRPEGSGTPR